MPPIPPRKNDDDLPLSFTQQRLWFLDRLLADKSLYNVHHAYRLKGTLNAAALKRSFHLIIQRHESLRTSFETLGGLPRQLIHHANSVTLFQEFISGTVQKEKLRNLQQRLEEEAHLPFVLNQGPPLRIRLYRLGEEDHVLQWVAHHIITDLWSSALLMRELSECYQALIRNEKPALPELAIQYADYALWQRQCLQGERLKRHTQYWRQQLKDTVPLALPMQQHEPYTARQPGGQETLALDAQRASRLKALSQQHRCTPFVTLLTAFQILLSRYCGQADVCVGIPAANRLHLDIENLIGFFVNTLVIRNRIERGATFESILRAVMATCLEAYDHQEVPFEKLVEDLNPQRDLDHNPFFQVMFAYQGVTSSGLELEDIQSRWMPVDVRSSQSKLTLVVWPTQHAWELRLIYRSDMFSVHVVKAMLRHYRGLLDAMLEDPRQIAFRVPLTSEAERRKILLDWNGSRVPYDNQQTLDALLRKQVERSPHHIAVQCGDYSLTYQALDHKANSLALTLRRRGVSAGDKVPLLMRNGAELPVSLKSVLKCGAAFVPLNCEWPDERLEKILTALGAPVLLVDGSFDRRRPVAADVLAVDVEQLDATQELPYETGHHAESALYVIYTSGSTGEPKGVINCHRGIVNLFQSRTRTTACGPDDVLLLTARPAFDSMVYQLLWPLTFGGRVIIPADNLPFDPNIVLETIQRDGVTTVFFVTSLLRIIVEHLDRNPDLALKLGSLRYLDTGGEEVDGRTVARFMAHCPQVAVSNVYGPSEAAIDAIQYRLPASPLERSVPIGRPVDNCYALILDADARVLPPGLPGEIHIGGDCLGLGYFDNPVETARRFIANPFPELKTDRLYRTGDFGRWSDDGNIVFLGRQDAQIKIRGQRIELAEIRHCMTAHEGVRDAYLRVLSHGTSQRLVAYVILTEAAKKAGRTLDMLRHLLERRLARYMVPDAFVVLNRFPLIANGKINSQALPVPKTGPRNADASLETPTEKTLAKIWLDLLPNGNIDAAADFFDLGGHSLLAVRAVGLINSELDRRIPLTWLFRYPILGQLAARIDDVEFVEQHLGHLASATQNEFMEETL